MCIKALPLADIGSLCGHLAALKLNVLQARLLENICVEKACHPLRRILFSSASVLQVCNEPSPVRRLSSICWTLPPAAEQGSVHDQDKVSPDLAPCCRPGNLRVPIHLNLFTPLGTAQAACWTTVFSIMMGKPDLHQCIGGSFWRSCSSRVCLQAGPGCCEGAGHVAVCSTDKWQCQWQEPPGPPLRGCPNHAAVHQVSCGG